MVTHLIQEKLSWGIDPGGNSLLGDGLGDNCSGQNWPDTKDTLQNESVKAYNNGGVLRNRCTRDVLVLENRSYVRNPKMAFLAE